MDRERNSGFTLIEISIVLVIIGLIVGGILIGQDLIHAATLRSAIKQTEQFNSAVNAFSLKYKCLPGDCAKASRFGFNAATNGNSDGKVGLCPSDFACRFTPPNFAVIGPESSNFWYHLSAARLIPESLPPYNAAAMAIGTASPTVKLSASSAFGTARGWAVVQAAPFTAEYGGGLIPNHTWVLAGVGATAITLAGMGVFYPADIAELDRKLDDGMPLTGRARGFLMVFTAGGGDYWFGALGMGTIGPGGPGVAICIRNDTATPEYNVQYAGGICGLALKSEF